MTNLEIFFTIAIMLLSLYLTLVIVALINTILTLKKFKNMIFNYIKSRKNDGK